MVGIGDLSWTWSNRRAEPKAPDHERHPTFVAYPDNEEYWREIDYLYAYGVEYGRKRLPITSPLNRTGQDLLVAFDSRSCFKIRAVVEI